MKQIDECLDRFFEGKGPLQKKWKAVQVHNGLLLYHYHHLVLVYNLDSYRIVYEWWQKQADKRGLDAAKLYLENKFKTNSC